MTATPAEPTALGVDANTVRAVLNAAGVDSRTIRTVPMQGRKWVRAGIHRDDTARADAAVKDAFPGRTVITDHAEVRVCVTL